MLGLGVNLEAKAMMRLTAAALAATLLGCAGAATAATTLYLDVDGCTGGCGLTSYGTATVTPMVGYTEVDINLAPNVYFARGDNGLDAAAFDVVGSPVLTDVVLSADFFAFSPHTAGTFTEGSLGNFQYTVGWSAGAGQGPQLQQLMFRLSGMNNSPATLGDTVDNGTALYLSVDIEHMVGGVMKEGVVGASLNPPAPPKPQTAAPEPAAWALMLTGFAGVGAALRRRRGPLAV